MRNILSKNMEKFKDLMNLFEEKTIYLKKLKGIYYFKQDGTEFNSKVDKIILSKDELSKIEKLCYLDGLIGFNASENEIEEIKKAYNENYNLAFLEIYNLLKNKLDLSISDSKCFKSNKMCCYSYKNFISSKILKEIKENYKYCFIFVDNKIDLLSTKILNVDFSEVLKLNNIGDSFEYAYIELMPDFLIKEQTEIEVQFKSIRKSETGIFIDFEEKSNKNNIITTIYKYDNFIIES